MWKVIDRCASLATLFVAISALIWAHIDSSQQSAVLDQSRSALTHVLSSVRAEAATLESVSNKLTAANGELDKLQQHTERTVVELQQVEGALRDVLATSRSLSVLDREIFRTSQRQLSLLTFEHGEEMARLNARPMISMQLIYDRGDARFGWVAPPNAPPQGTERTLSWLLILSNKGDAAAQHTVVIITGSADLGLGGCANTFPHTIQCDSPDILRRGSAGVRFTIDAPKSAGIYFINVWVQTRNEDGTIVPFSRTFAIYLRPVPVP
jgi:hypothetical protein